ncbi:MAG: flagellar basal-body MS-ring/collar protein FliF [Thermodesulfobacteriota bacterium]
MATLPEQIKVGLGGMSVGKKISYLAFIGVVVAGLVVFVLWSQQPVYRVLYANLDPDDAGTVISKIKEQRILYKVEDGGRTILVPKEMVYDVRLDLASQGLPQGGGVGFEIFDRTNLGMSEFVQKINYRRALQGELARTIAQLTEVNGARVHLAMPEPSLFLRDEKKTTASVILKLASGTRLNNSQVRGIVHLVANSIEGLHSEDVTVVDTSGKILTKSTGGDLQSQMSSSQLEYQNTFEKGMEKRILVLLGKALGTDKARVMVAADLDFKMIERTEEVFDPESVVVRSEERSQEKSKGSSPTSGGAPGVASNLPGGLGASGGASPFESKRDQETINYEMNKVTSRIIEPTGTVKKLSIAVLVDGTYKALEGAEGEGEKEYVPRSDEELKRIETLVKGAIGFTAERGDVVEIVNIAFTNEPIFTDIETLPSPSFIKELLPSILRYASTIVVVVLMIFFVLKPMIRALGGGGVGGGGRMARQSLQGAGPASDMKAIEEEIIVPKSVGQKERLEMTVKDDPQQAARIIKGWLKEE